MTAGGGAVDQNREPGLVENVHPVVAGDRVRADADFNPGGEEWEKRSDAVPEFGVRCGAVCHRAASPSHNRHVVRVHAYAVDEQWPALQRATLFEQRDRRSRARRDVDPPALPTLRKIPGGSCNEVELRLALGDVHCERQVMGVGESSRGIVKRIRDGVRRVWRDTERDEVGLFESERGHAIFQFTHRDFRVRWVGPEYFLVHDAAHARIAHRLHRDAARARVCVGCDSGFEALDNPKAGGVEQSFLIHDLVPAPSQFVDPHGESTILEETAHGGELEVCVRVDQTRKEDRVAEVIVLTPWS